MSRFLLAFVTLLSTSVLTSSIWLDQSTEDFCKDNSGVECKFNETLIEVSITNSSNLHNLWDIPKEIGSNLISLIWTHQSTIKQLSKDGSTLNFPKLIHLELSHTSLDKISLTDLSGFPSLKTLKLNDNHLKTVDWRSFRRYPPLQLVELSGNPLQCDCSLLWLKVYRGKLQGKRNFRMPFKAKPNVQVSVQTLAGLPVNIDIQKLQCQQETVDGQQQRIQIVNMSRTNCSWPKAKFLNDNSTDHMCNTSGSSVVKSSVIFASNANFSSRIESATVPDGIHNVTIVGNLTSNSLFFGMLTCEAISDGIIDVDIVPVYPHTEPHIIRAYLVNQTRHGSEEIYLEVLSIPGFWLNLSQNGQQIPINYTKAQVVWGPWKVEQFYMRNVTLIIKEPNTFHHKFIIDICNEFGCSQVIVDGKSILYVVKPTEVQQISSTLQPTNKTWSIATNISLTLVLLVLFLALITIIALKGHRWYKHRRAYRPYSIGSTSTNGSELLGLTAITTARVKENLNYTDLSDVNVIPSAELSMARELGEGAFGKVFLVFWRKGDETTPLAAKSLKEVSQQQICSFEKEAKLIATLDHSNIVKFYGISYNSTCALMLLFEFMEHGDLKNYLIEHGPNATHIGVISSRRLNDLELISAALQVARGLAYLAGRFFVHRDVAARNCLVRGDLEVKIGDFGMSRDIYFSDYYKVSKERALLPVRWLPPESLKLGKFTTESDVWSFGVLMFEIFSYGLQPYFRHSNAEVVSLILLGETLSPPENCPSGLDVLMKSCWKQIPSERPKMTDICDELDSLYGSQKQSDHHQNDYVDVIP